MTVHGCWERKILFWGMGGAVKRPVLLEAMLMNAFAYRKGQESRKGTGCKESRYQGE